MSCGTCKRIRAHMPVAIRARLEQIEQRMAANRRRPQITVNYSTGQSPHRSEAGKSQNPARVEPADAGGAP